MSIQRTKIFKFFIIIIISSIALLCCKKKSKNTTLEIFKGYEIVNENYVYSEESIFKIKDKTYSLRNKVFYNNQGEVDKLLVYKSEGIIEYTKEEIMKDKLLLETVGLPLSLSWSYDEGILVINEEKMKLKKVKDNVLLGNDRNKVIFYKIY